MLASMSVERKVLLRSYTALIKMVRDIFDNGQRFVDFCRNECGYAIVFLAFSIKLKVCEGVFVLFNLFLCINYSVFWIRGAFDPN